MLQKLGFLRTFSVPHVRFLKYSQSHNKWINKILIANRGEIACRIIKTSQKLGIKTVAVYSDCDINCMHVRMADEAYHIGPPPAIESYLKGETILEIAKKAGANAIHPGYGFLSENEHFARDCEKKGIIFVGPPASAIQAMGSKSASKDIMIQANVPVVPGYHGEDQSFQKLAEEAKKIGYPVMLKAVLGGGGKGMRIVNDPSELPEALETCKQEALNSFKDDRVLIEKYIKRPRHIEIQVFADSHGNVVYLFERDCSVQRRHQKIIEEAPAPGMTPELRAKMGEAAVNCAKAVGYRGAGTVEFIFDVDAGNFYFMEMNTRLQVEHPVTEMITKQDLVDWQIQVAEGKPLPLTQSQLSISGHAFEARIYAENPDKGFIPGIGTLDYLQLPKGNPENLRIDTGVRQGDEVSIFYDPMISKLIVWDKDRTLALRRLRVALENYHIAGLHTNIPFLLRLASHPQFIKANLDTGFIQRHRNELIFDTPPNIPLEAVAITQIYLMLNEIRELKNQAGDPFSPWGVGSGFRLNHRFTYSGELKDSDGDRNYSIQITFVKENTYEIKVKTQGTEKEFKNVIANQKDGKLDIIINEVKINPMVVESRSSILVNFFGEQYELRRVLPSYQSKHDDIGSLHPPMPGIIKGIFIAIGESVKKGTPLIVMEAMKIVHKVNSPKDGIVKSINCAVGDLVNMETTLVTIE